MGELDPRFDARNAGFENEVNHFSWIVEIDPTDPTSTPRKHTAMGRFKHEGANVILASDGRAVAYMGDDERFDYLYKFVSRDAFMRRRPRAQHHSPRERRPLRRAHSAGNSPEAEIDGSGRVPSDGAFDGTGEWIPLTRNGESVIDGMSIDEVLVHTRLAADKVGATKMDRPEDVEPNPITGRVYVACTNNTQRGIDGDPAADEMNPRTENRDGHIVGDHRRPRRPDGDDVRLEPPARRGQPGSERRDLLLGIPRRQGLADLVPDNVAFDSVGNLWISTDGQPGTIGYNDGLFRVALEGPERGKVEQFLSVPREAETCGPVIHDDEWHVFVAVQHPGEGRIL